MTNISDETIAKLFLLEHPSADVPEMFKQIYATIAPHAKTSEVPWGIVLPERLAEKYNKDLELFGNRIQSLRDSSSYLRDIFIPTEHYLFGSGNIFQSARVNPVLFEQYQIEDKTNVVSSFEPDPEGYAKPTRYSRISSVTGRLTVVEGPNILNLKKQYRNMIISRWGQSGAIIGLDYQALEPSLLISLNNSSFFSTPPHSLGPPEERKREESIASSCKALVSTEREKKHTNNALDPYMEVMMKTGLTNHSSSMAGMREIMKSITVSRMNGMQASGLISKIERTFRLGHDMPASKLVEIVDDVLCLDNVQNRLYAEWTQRNSCSYIENYYGRPVRCDTDNMLINRYFQSSAVDVAMCGFKNILSYIKESIPASEEFLQTVIAPLFVVHDMIVFDVNTAPEFNGLTTINSLAKIGSVDLPGFEDGSFKLRQTPFIQVLKSSGRQE